MVLIRIPSVPHKYELIYAHNSSVRYGNIILFCSEKENGPRKDQMICPMLQRWPVVEQNINADFRRPRSLLASKQSLFQRWLLVSIMQRGGRPHFQEETGRLWMNHGDEDELLHLESLRFGGVCMLATSQWGNLRFSCVHEVTRFWKVNYDIP